MKNKILAIILCLICLLSLCGCGSGNEPLPYNMRRVPNVRFTEEFELSNSTYLVLHYIRIKEDGSKVSEIWRDVESPGTRGVIINDFETLNSVCDIYYQKDKIDFDTKMVVILFYSNFSFGGQKIHKARIDNDVLYIYFTPSRSYEKGRDYIQDYLVIEMDKLPIKDVKKG